ncbi:bifunctional adenosylcobinamide kinase/adenosylcobinamide-phosphate guanylyltransferase [Paenibacillus daejeonensis]|uniref:bifunctional adenosylcobinamide kinase/adenosylcobinamide-phosphate guanylyltransferase n=1 Tax=Paenibacillus daejeonensis TaxID=135193 RepID=UPI00037B4857|nr:bifunctional adenosylcobinamide kinase/adenosylcobinamide-phosphate guanylyltransferase [Paenibacillus daejeonensis]
MAILITGGARSGKSAFAEAAAVRLADNGIYLATLQPRDEEMAERVRLHRAQREQGELDWLTLETPSALVEQLRELAAQYAGSERPPVVLIDCLTLWLTNRMLALEGEDSDWRARQTEALDQATEELIRLCADYPLPLLLVTNEVGSGIVPEYPLGRRFRDEAGRLNRRLAAVCERVYLVTAGIPVELKAIAARLDDL